MVMHLISQPAFARRVRSPLDWKVFLEAQLKEMIPAYPIPEVVAAVEKAQEHLPKAMEWVEHIFRNYQKLGGGKLVFLGGAAKKPFQEAKVLSVNYSIDPQKIIYLDLPRILVDALAEKGFLIRYLEENGVLDSTKEPVAFMDNYPLTGETYLALATSLKESSNYKKIPLYLGFLTLSGDSDVDKELSNNFGGIDEFMPGDFSLGKFFEDTPRFKELDRLQPFSIKEGKITLNYIPFPNGKAGYRAQVQVLYGLISEKFSLPVPTFISQDNPAALAKWEDFLVSVFKKINTAVTFSELKNHLGVVDSEDENWFIRAIAISLDDLVSQGRIKKTRDYYQLPR